MKSEKIKIICEEMLESIQNLTAEEVDELVQFFLFKLNKKNNGDFRGFIKSH